MRRALLPIIAFLVFSIPAHGQVNQGLYEVVLGVAATQALGEAMVQRFHQLVGDSGVCGRAQVKIRYSHGATGVGGATFDFYHPVVSTRPVRNVECARWLFFNGWLSADEDGYLHRGLATEPRSRTFHAMSLMVLMKDSYPCTEPGHIPSDYPPGSSMRCVPEDSLPAHLLE